MSVSSSPDPARRLSEPERGEVSSSCPFGHLRASFRREFDILQYRWREAVSIGRTEAGGRRKIREDRSRVEYSPQHL